MWDWPKYRFAGIGPVDTASFYTIECDVYACYTADGMEPCRAIAEQCDDNYGDNFGLWYPGDPTKAALTNPRFAYPVATYYEGTSVESWPGFDVSLAIDGNLGLDGTDHAAHSEYEAPYASLFVDFRVVYIADSKFRSKILIFHRRRPVERFFYMKTNLFHLVEGPSAVNFVKIWPRLNGSNGFTRYEGMELYADQVFCPSNKIYTPSYVQNTLIPNQEPLIFTCPFGTSASTIQLTRGTNSGWVELAEIEVFST